MSAALCFAIAVLSSLAIANAQKACGTSPVVCSSARICALQCEDCNVYECVKAKGAKTGYCIEDQCNGLNGDPEMRGPDGRKFYFHGAAGKVFNLLSEKNHQVNALFVEGPHRMADLGQAGEHNGTYVGAIGMKLFNEILDISVTEEGQMSVLLNQEKMTAIEEENYVKSVAFPGVKVTYEEYKLFLGQTVTIKTDLYELTIYPTLKEFNFAENQVTRGHLNMIMKVNADLYAVSDVHGVLGQISPISAADNSMMQPELQTTFLGEGEEFDYLVSDLFADDFQFNRYEKPTATAASTASTSSLQINSSRKLQSVEADAKKSDQWISLGHL